MKRMLRHRMGKRIGSVVLALVLTMPLMSSLSGSVLAEDNDFDLSGDVIIAAGSDEAVNLISQDEFSEAGEDIAAGLTADTESDIDADSALEDDTMAVSEVVFDEEDSGTLEEDGILDIIADEDPNQEEDGIEVLEAADAEEPEETEEEILNAASGENGTEEDAGPGSGNVEVFTDPAFLEKMGLHGTESGTDPDGLVQAADSTVNAVYPHTGTVPASAYKNISIKQSGSTVTISGKLADGYYFVSMGVDFDPAYQYDYVSSCPNTLNMNNYSTGYHTVVLGVSDKARTNTCVIGRKFISSNTITARPNSKGVFEVYSSYFNYYPYGSFGNSAGNLYMEYSSNGGKTWQRSGYMKYSLITTASQQGYKIGGLREKTTYMTRIRYGENVTYSTASGGDGKSYFFGGPVLNTTTIKTGSSSKLKIKSVTVKAIKVKYHKVRHPGYYNYVGGTLFWHSAYTEKFYTCSVKITVRLKKKPGTKGIFINGKFVKGNKKTYTAKFTPYPNYYAKRPKGRYKYLVSVCSGQDSSYGGYSPLWQKKKKYS